MSLWHPRTLIAGLAVLAAAGFAWVSTTSAEPPAKPAAKVAPPKVTPKKGDVQISLRVVHARRSGKFIDRRIQDIQRKLKRLFQFSFYRMVKEEQVTLPFGVETRVPTPLPRVAVYLTNKGLTKGKIGLTVKLGRKQTVQLKLANGGTFLQGVTLKNGQNYILAVTARAR